MWRENLSTRHLNFLLYRAGSWHSSPVKDFFDLNSTLGLFYVLYDSAIESSGFSPSVCVCWTNSRKKKVNKHEPVSVDEQKNQSMEGGGLSILNNFQSNQ